jgi:hypothetical protein
VPFHNPTSGLGHRFEPEENWVDVYSEVGNSYMTGEYRSFKATKADIEEEVEEDKRRQQRISQK